MNDEERKRVAYNAKRNEKLSCRKEEEEAIVYDYATRLRGAETAK
jgi:hypothetical protein